MLSLRGKHLKARLSQPLDELWDRRLGIRTFGHHPGTGGPGEREWYMHYIPTPYADVFRALRHAGVGPDDVVTDLGCGLGRVVFAAAWLGAERAQGVELVDWLAAKAERNRDRGRIAPARIRFVHADARTHDFSETTCIYMFHPFGDAILEEVLHKVQADRRAASSPKPLRIAYVNPVAEPVLERCAWLRKTGSLPPVSQRWSRAEHYVTSFWSTIAWML